MGCAGSRVLFQAHGPIFVPEAREQQTCSQNTFGWAQWMCCSAELLLLLFKGCGNAASPLASNSAEEGRHRNRDSAGAQEGAQLP